VVRQNIMEEGSSGANLLILWCPGSREQRKRLGARYILQRHTLSHLLHIARPFLLLALTAMNTSVSSWFNYPSKAPSAGDQAFNTWEFGAFHINVVNGLWATNTDWRSNTASKFSSSVQSVWDQFSLYSS
jgi:hypothetical protein